MIYDLLMREMSDRHLYLYETYGPFFICSYAMHHFNLVNKLIDPVTKQSKASYWIGGKVPDARSSLLMIAPSGYMKTTYFDTMEDIVGNAGAKMVHKSTMSEAAFIGTVKDVNGSPVKTDGVAEKHAKDIVMIGEFSAITQAMKQAYNANLGSQLLDVLDHGNVNKDLGAGGFGFNTQLTMWAGVQPSHYELSSGLGRRICPLIFLPTKADDNILQDLKPLRAGVRKDYDRHEIVTDKVHEWIEQFTIIKEVTFAPSVYQLHKDINLFQYESEYFDRILLGYHLAKYGPSENIVVDVGDTEIRRLIEIQKKWRGIIYEGIDSVMILNITKSVVTKTDEGLIAKRKDIAKACEMVSWNKRDVYKKLKELVDDGHISQVGEVVRWLGPID